MLPTSEGGIQCECGLASTQKVDITNQDNRSGVRCSLAEVSGMAKACGQQVAIIGRKIVVVNIVVDDGFGSTSITKRDYCAKDAAWDDDFCII